jgi:hypothetical protein
MQHTVTGVSWRGMKKFSTVVLSICMIDEENQVYFFDDIYGHDASLEKVLAKGHPYPS